MEGKYVSAIILAAGVGSRMKSDITKQQIALDGKSILKRTLEIFESASSVTDIIIVTRADEIEFVKSESFGFKKIKDIVIGGKTRAESAKRGFDAIDEKCEFVAIHDGARCFTQVELVNRVIADAIKHNAATVSSFINDTVKVIDENGFVLSTPARSLLRFVGTPQVFAKELYGRALASVDVLDPSITDDNMLLEKIGIPVFCTDSDDFNLKLTTQNDILYAEFVLKRMKKGD